MDFGIGVGSPRARRPTFPFSLLNSAARRAGEVVVPQTIKELKQYLKDDVPRVVLLNRTFDFTGSEGTATREGCVFLPCGRGRQYSLAESDTCDGRQRADVSPTRTSGTAALPGVADTAHSGILSIVKVTFDVAGISPLNVGSFKTIAGVEGRGVIRGKGLKVRKAQQVIIRDLSIVDINPAVIWGGDALVLNGVEQAWIHNVTFKVSHAARPLAVPWLRLALSLSRHRCCVLPRTSAGSSWSPTRRVTWASQCRPAPLTAVRSTRPSATVSTTGCGSSGARTTASPSSTTRSSTPAAACPMPVDTPCRRYDGKH